MEIVDFAVEDLADIFFGELLLDNLEEGVPSEYETDYGFHFCIGYGVTNGADIFERVRHCFFEEEMFASFCCGDSVKGVYVGGGGD